MSEPSPPARLAVHRVLRPTPSPLPAPLPQATSPAPTAEPLPASPLWLSPPVVALVGAASGGAALWALDAPWPAALLGGALAGLAGWFAAWVRRSRRASGERERRLRTLLAEASGRALWTSGPGDSAWFSDGWDAFFGIRAGAASSLTRWFDRVHPEDLGALLHALEAVRSGAQPSLRATYRLQLDPGFAPDDVGWFEVHATRVLTPEGPVLAGSVADVTVQQRMQDRLAHTAFHDALTGLPNRALFLDRLAHCTARARRNPHYRFAIVFLDIDEFKVINDSLGHTAGDELLATVARRLQASVRPGDTVARMGGDEFTVLLEPVVSPADAEGVAARIRESTHGSTYVHGHLVQLTTSIGVAFASGEHLDPLDLLRDADTAMYQAKHDGPGRLRLFDQAMHDTAMRRLQVESELRRALDEGTLRVHYQPIVRLDTGAIEGFEALVRLHTSQGTLIGPGEFIPLAETLGLIDGVFAAVLEAAASNLARWTESHPTLYISVNVSARSLRPGLVTLLSETLARHGLKTRSLKLELTESVLVGSSSEATAELVTLRELGVGLYIDDFGTGYSSLSYLHQFPVDHIKLDRAFVAALDGDRTPEIVETIVTLSERIGASVIAEGIETRSQLLALRALNCRSGQGFLFAPALPEDQASQLLAEGRTWPVSSPVASVDGA